MKIKLLNTKSFPAEQLKNLLKVYNLEEFYLKTIKTDIDFDKFIDFKVSNIKKRVENGNKIWEVLDNSNNLVAVFGLQRSESRSRNFGIEYYEFNPMFNFSKEAYEALQLFEQEVLSIEVDSLGIQYLKAKVNASDYSNIAAFCNSNYTFIGTSLNLYLSRNKFIPEQSSNTNLEIIDIEEKHLGEIKAILTQHNHNEDFYDTEIEDKKTHDNFYDWLYNFYLTQKGRLLNNTDIILLYDKVENEIVGFSCYTKEPNFSKLFGLNLITRDLTIIPEKHHNKGYGSVLFSEIMKRENKNVELKLMSNNYKAIGFNHRNGFKCVSSSHFFRKIFTL